MEHGAVGYLNVTLDLYALANYLWPLLNPPGGGPPPYRTFNGCAGTTYITEHYLRRLYADQPEAERDAQVAALLHYFAGLGGGCDCEIYTRVVLAALHAMSGPPARG
jgi:hypothetical protein